MSGCDRQDDRSRIGAVKKAAVAAGLVALLLAGVASGWALATVRPWQTAAAPAVSRLLNLPSDDEAEPEAQIASPSPPSLEPHVVALSLGDFKYVGNLRKKRYHLATCDDVKAMSQANIHGFNSVAEAIEKGLKPCEHCQPDAQPAAEGEG